MADEAIDQAVVNTILAPKPAAPDPQRDARGQFIKENPRGVTLSDDPSKSLDHQVRIDPAQAREDYLKRMAENDAKPKADDTKPVAAETDETDGPEEDEEAPDDQGDDDENDENPDGDDPEDIDNFLVDVKVDGKDEEVPLKDLKANWSGNKFVEKQLQQAVERRKAADTDAYQAHQVLGVQVQKLKQVDTLLSSITGADVDWNKLRAENPEEFNRKRLEFFEAEKAQNEIRKATEEAQAEQDRLNEEAKKRYIADQSYQLASKIPDLADPKKAPALMGRLAEAAEKYGFTRQEFVGVLDHRVMLVLQDVAKYHDALEKNKDPRPKEQRLIKHLKRPSSSPNRQQVQQTQSRKLDQKAIDRARETGSPDDVAATLIQRRSSQNGVRR